MSDSQENTENCKLRAYQRNNYYYGKLMTVRDFELEQQYFNDKRWLMNRLMFGSGTVCGLRVTATGMDVTVTSGLAIDGCGREIVLPENLSLTLSNEDSPSPGKKKAIYISFIECPKERVRAQTASTCEEVCANNRTEESYKFDIITVQDEAPGISDETLCGIWNNLSTKTFDYLFGNVQIRISRKVKNYVSPGDVFEVHLSITNLSETLISFSASKNSLSDILPPGLILIDGNNNLENISIPPKETANIWYVVRVDPSQSGNIAIKTNINGTVDDETSSIIEVISPHDIPENLQKNLAEFWTKPCFDSNEDTRVKIAELSLGTDTSGKQAIIVDNTKRTLVNNDKYITRMLECLKKQTSELEDQSIYLKNKIAPSKILLSASPGEIDANGTSVSEITITVQNTAGVGLSGIDVILISTLGSIPNHVTTGLNGTVKATLKSGTIPGIAAVLASTGSGAAVIQVEFISTTGSIEGYVKDKTDEDIKIIGAIVSVGTITTLTDNEGHYLLQNVPQGNQVVWAFSPGYDKATSLIDVRTGLTNNVDIFLTPISTVGEITGRVQDKDGNVIENIVSVTAGGITTTADETGNYKLSNVPSDTYTVTASADGYQTQSISSVVVTDDHTTSGIDFNLERATGTIKGRVTTISGMRTDILIERNPEISGISIIPGSNIIPLLIQGIIGATVSVIGTSLSARTDEAGNYVINNVPLGTHTVTASAPDYNSATSSVLVEANKIITLNFRLSRLITTGTVSGRVTTLRKQIVPICTGATPRITSIPIGTPIVRPLDTTNIGTISCISGGPSIICVVGGPGSSTEEIGISGAKVSVAGISTITDSQGNYIINNVPAGSQDVVANAAGYVAGRSTVNVPAGGTVTANFRLTVAVSRGTISGRVTTARANICTGASPLLIREAAVICIVGGPGSTSVIGINGATVSVTGTTLSAVTDASGNYSIPDIPTGSYTVIASAPGYNTGTQKPIVNENQTTLVNFQLDKVICAAGQPDVPCLAGQPRILCVTGAPNIACLAGRPDNIIEACSSGGPAIFRPPIVIPPIEEPPIIRPPIVAPIDRIPDIGTIDRIPDIGTIDRTPGIGTPTIARPIIMKSSKVACPAGRPNIVPKDVENKPTVPSGQPTIAPKKAAKAKVTGGKKK